MACSTAAARLVRVLLVSALTAGSLACAEPIGRTELLAAIEAGSAPPVVDVRSKGEYDASHVPGAVHVPFYTLLWSGDRIPPPADEAEPIVLTCEHGPRAGIARAQLWLTGGPRVVYLEGHMSAWKRDGLPVVGSEVPAAE